MIILNRYRIDKREVEDAEGVKFYKLYIISEEDIVCPICIKKLKVIGIRDRVSINSAGIKEVYVIRRLRCSKCNKIHHELPDKIIPYKRHCAETVENIINGEVEDVCCDFVTESRIKAWWSSVHQHFASIITSLQTKYGKLYSTNPTPREIVRAIANAHLWAHTRSAMLSG